MAEHAYYSVQNLKLLLRSLVVSTSKTLTVEDLDRDFYLAEGISIPFSTFGFNRLDTFLGSIDDVLTCKHMVNGTTIVKAVPKADCNGIAALVRQQQQKKRNEPTVGCHLDTRPMSRKCAPSGTRKSDCYVNEERLDDHAPIETKPEYVPVRNAIGAVSALPPIDVDDPLFLIGLPENICGAQQRIASAQLPASLKAGSSMRVFITEARSPTRFWYQLESAMNDFNDLMSNMGKFYAETTATYTLREIHVMPGFPCVALYEGRWQRAVIRGKRAPIDDTMANDAYSVQVYFCDYGIKSIVPPSHVQYLRTDFVRLPAQAHRGCLDFVRPAVGNRWDQRSTSAFFKCVRGEFLLAHIEHIDADAMTYLVLKLSHPSSGHLVVHDFLLKRNYAKLLYVQEE